jgi:glutamyl-tRNA synthetase
LEEKGIDACLEYIEAVVGLVKDRVNFVQELWDQSFFFFEAPASYDEKVVKKRWKEESPAQMSELAGILEQIEDFSAHNQEEIVKSWIENKGYHQGNIMNAFRLAVVGESKGPHMFDITATIGKDETISRLNKAIWDIKM